MGEMHTYIGKGPVFDYFGKYLGDASRKTRAVSKKKAWSNMLYQVKRDMGLQAGAFLRWDAEIEEV